MLLAFAGVRAQERINIGYCHGEVSKTGSVSVEGNTWVSGAAYFPESMLNRYKGSMESVRVGLVSKINVDTVRVWVRKELDGADLAHGEINIKTDGILRGWNDIALETPYQVTGEEPLYIGFTYKQRSKVEAISVLTPGQENAFFYKAGTDAAWEDRSKTGTLSVEAVVAGDDLPQYDLGLFDAKAQPNLKTDVINITVGVHNVAMNAVDGFTINTCLEGTDTEYTNHFDLRIEPYENKQVSFEIPYSINAGTQNAITLTLASLDNGEDAIPGNNITTVALSFARKVLIEEFTTEKCGNCPRVAGYLHDVLNLPQYQDKVVAVCHHAGYNTDVFTQQCDKDLLFLFGGDGTYAPAMMWDRAVLDNSGSPVICPDKNDILNGCDKRLAVAASSIIGIKGVYDDATGKLNIDITGYRQQDAGSETENLTVYLLEDNVQAYDQANGGSNFKHQHLIRRYNSTQGVRVDWEDNSFSKEIQFDVEDGWVLEEMSVVAFLHAMNRGNISKCEVDNAESVKLVEMTSGIEQTVCDSEIVKEEYYTINGIKVSPQDLQEGIYIVRSIDAGGKVTAKKIMVGR